MNDPFEKQRRKDDWESVWLVFRLLVALGLVASAMRLLYLVMVGG
jgi:hypothetical protein